MNATKYMLLLLCLTGTLLSNGCASSRIVTDFRPEADPELSSQAGMFYIAELKYTYTNSDNKKNNLENDFSKKCERFLLPILRKNCIRYYPALFTEEPTDAIPLDVTVENTFNMHEGKTMGWMFGTLLISGLIFPVPVEQDEDIVVKICIWNEQRNIHQTPLKMKFERVFHAWVSILTPIALIPVPGESDFPKTSVNITEDFYGQKTLLPQLASQVTTAIAKMITTTDPAYWATHLYPNNKTFYSPVATPRIEPPEIIDRY